MDDPIYTLLLRSDATCARSAERASLLAHLTRIPGVERCDGASDRFEFGEADQHGVMSIELFVRRDAQRVPPEDVRDDEAARCDEVEICIPRPWVLERGPRVFALVFMLAEWAHWEVFDPQISDTLQKEAVLSGLVAMRQAQRDHQARASGEAAAAQTPGSAGRPGSPPTVEHGSYVPRTGQKPSPSRKKWWKLGS